jgi:NADPH2:quinone reductase
MNPTIPATMRAAAIDRFGGPEELSVRSLPVPRPRAGEVLIELETAGIGVWDPYMRKGELAPDDPSFPLVIGNDGAGTVVAVGRDVERFKPGDHVYAYTMDGGFYAEYVAVNEEAVAPLPRRLELDEAGALGADGITALRGLDDQLHLAAGQTLLVCGASGGIGHLAVQLAKRMGARVVAIASGKDGVELVRRLGADVAIDGRQDGLGEAVRAAAPGGIDAALVLADGERFSTALGQVKRGGRVAYPNGVEPEPRVGEGVTLLAYDGEPSPEAFERLNRLIAAGPFHVELGRVYSLEDAALAHQHIEDHHLGKLAFRLRGH